VTRVLALLMIVYLAVALDRLWLAATMNAATVDLVTCIDANRPLPNLVARFERLTASEGQRSAALLHLGHCRLLLGDLEGSLEAVSGIVDRMRSRIGFALYGRGLYAHGAIDEAVDVCIRMRDTVTLLLMVDELGKQDRLNEAEAVWYRAYDMWVSMHAEGQDAHLVILELTRTGHRLAGRLSRGRGAKVLISAVSLGVGNPATYRSIADNYLYLSAGAVQLAEPWIHRALRGAPENVSIGRVWQRFAQKAGYSTEESDSVRQAVLMSDVADCATTAQVGALCAERGYWVQAVDWYREAVEFCPTNPEYRQALSEALCAVQHPAANREP